MVVNFRTHEINQFTDIQANKKKPVVNFFYIKKNIVANSIIMEKLEDFIVIN
jgi:hypothetical protein